LDLKYNQKLTPWVHLTSETRHSLFSPGSV